MKVEIVRAVKRDGVVHPAGTRLEMTRAEFDALPEGVAREMEWYSEALRSDGPTFEEYVEAGYSPESYPPRGYMEKPSDGLDAYRAQQQGRWRGNDAGNRKSAPVSQ